MELTLVVLAAGLGSRFGGPKQLEPIGPGGATLMDYSVWDAARAGFSKVVVVVRPDLEDDVRRRLEGRYGQGIQASTVLQRIDDVSAGRFAGRTKPWGTAQAVLAARYSIKGPFAVINGDDFYGAAAYTVAADFLRKHKDDTPPTWALAGYKLSDTLSPNGGVNRAVCRVDSSGVLRNIEEVRAVSRTSDGVLRGLRASGARVLSGEEIVSMNFWAFTPSVFGFLERAFAKFLLSRNAANGELLLPEVVQEAVSSGAARVEILDGGRDWFGLTHPTDRDDVRASIQRLIAAGDYPDRPWG